MRRSSDTWRVRHATSSFPDLRCPHQPAPHKVAEPLHVKSAYLTCEADPAPSATRLPRWATHYSPCDDGQDLPPRPRAARNRVGIHWGVRGGAGMVPRGGDAYLSPLNSSPRPIKKPPPPAMRYLARPRKGGVSAASRRDGASGEQFQDLTACKPRCTLPRAGPAPPAVWFRVFSDLEEGCTSIPPHLAHGRRRPREVEQRGT